MTQATKPKATPEPREEARAVRLLVTEVMNIQKRLADKSHPEARTLWHALERFATNPATTTIIR